jgi:hypothetical protein
MVRTVYSDGCLISDSMGIAHLMDARELEYLSTALQILCQRHEPFGGLTVYMAGDTLQSIDVEQELITKLSHTSIFTSRVTVQVYHLAQTFHGV